MGVEGTYSSRTCETGVKIKQKLLLLSLPLGTSESNQKCGGGGGTPQKQGTESSYNEHNYYKVIIIIIIIIIIIKTTEEKKRFIFWSLELY
jgi:hypothetical protein